MALGDIIQAPVQNIQIKWGAASQPWPFILHIDGNVFAISQRHPPNNEVRTYNISDAGIITFINNLTWFGIDPCFAHSYMVHHWTNLYLIARHEAAPTGTRGLIDVVSISNDGTTLNYIAGPYQFTPVTTSHHPLVKLAENYFAVFYTDAVGDGVVQTFHLSNNGLNFTLINNLVFEAGWADEIMTAPNIAGDIYAMAYKAAAGIAGLGRIRTVSISTDGATIVAIDALDFDTQGRWPFIGHIFNNIYAISYAGNPAAAPTGQLTTLEITPAGALAQLATLQFDAGPINYSVIEHLGLDMIAVFYQGGVGAIGTVVTIEVGDGTTPVIYDGPDNIGAQARYQRPTRVPETNIYALSHEAAGFLGWLATFNIDSRYPPIVQTDPATEIT